MIHCIYIYVNIALYMLIYNKIVYIKILKRLTYNTNIIIFISFRFVEYNK